MLQSAIPLTLVVCLRFLGLFIVLPVLSIYLEEFHSSPVLVGLAFGGAYLSQIIFQSPFGILSDKIDRKKIVIIGLFIFMIGSIICALAHDIELLILGRFIQGAGAIGGVVSAQIADLVREESRTQAMAIMGGGIFASFTLAMLVGPLIGGYFGVDWLFAITAFLTLIAIFLFQFKVPNTPKIAYSFDYQSDWRDVLKNKNLLIMNTSSFLEKALMTLIFVVIPLIFIHKFNMHEEELWKIYTPGAILGIFALAPASILAEKYGKAKLVMCYGIIFFLVAYILIGFGGYEEKLWLFVVGIILFFIGFATLEPIMQSLTSKYAKANLRGAALGIFTTCAYIGSFIGAISGSILYYTFGLGYLVAFIAIICVLWLALLLYLKNPAKQKNLYLPIAQYNPDMIHTIDKKEGIIECYINYTEGVIVLKYDNTIITQDEAQHIASEIRI